MLLSGRPFSEILTSEYEVEIFTWKESSIIYEIFDIIEKW